MEYRLIAKQTNAPKFITWIVSLILFIVAIAAHFAVIHVSSDIASWSWIIGYALLLVAVQVGVYRVSWLAWLGLAVLLLRLRR